MEGGGCGESRTFFIMDILNFINTVGFPIFVAVFFIVKLDKTLQNIEKSVNDLIKIIEIKLDSKTTNLK